MTPPERTPEEAVETAEGLRKALAALTAAINEIRDTLHRNKIFSRVLAISLAFDLLLTIVIGVITYEQHSLTVQLQQAQVASCQSSNVVRTEDVHLWNTVIADLTPPPAQQDAHDKATLAELRHQVNITFALKNCSLSAIQHSAGGSDTTTTGHATTTTTKKTH